MKILIGVGDKMMAAVMAGPPQRAFLVRRGSRKRDQKLEDPAGSIGAMSQQTMKPGGNRKHAHNIQSQTNNDSHCAHAGPNDQQTCQVHAEKLDTDETVQFVAVDSLGGYQRFRHLGEPVRIKNLTTTIKCIQVNATPAIASVSNSFVRTVSGGFVRTTCVKSLECVLKRILVEAFNEPAEQAEA